MVLQKKSESENEDLADLLFELSNADRLAILSKLYSKNSKLSELAEDLSATVQETSRHLERMARSGLVEKNPEGEFFITAIGKLCLEEIESLRFVTANRSFLADHDLTLIPEKFVHRVGELLNSNYARNVTDVLRHTEEVLSGASEYILLMADQALLPTYSGNIPASLSGKVKFKSIIPRAIFSSLPAVSPIPENIEVRFLDNPRVGIAINEKIAGVTFSDLKGRLDMSAGFRGNDSQFHAWCLELFFHYWKESGDKKEKEEPGSFIY